MNIKKTPYMDPLMARYYAEASVKHHFAHPAKDLVAWLQISKADRVLDIGSGSGTVASAAAAAVGPSASIVALDASLEMLKQQPDARIAKVLASAQNLPFQDQVFDFAVAGFVISHIPDFRAALTGMMHVLRPSGTFGATAWASGMPPVSEVWKSTIGRFTDLKRVQEEFARIIPWDELFSERERLEEALQTAGYVNVSGMTKAYWITVDADEYVSTRIGSIEGTLVRDALTEGDWKRFLNDLLLSVRKEFPNRIEYKRNVHFVSGKRPS